MFYVFVREYFTHIKTSPMLKIGCKIKACARRLRSREEFFSCNTHCWDTGPRFLVSGEGCIEDLFSSQFTSENEHKENLLWLKFIFNPYLSKTFILKSKIFVLYIYISVLSFADRHLKCQRKAFLTLDIVKMWAIRKHQRVKKPSFFQRASKTFGISRVNLCGSVPVQMLKGYHSTGEAKIFPA